MAKSPDRLNDPAEEKKVFLLLAHVLDQSAAEHRDAGEYEAAEMDKKLADSAAGLVDALRKFEQNFQRRTKRNKERKAQGLPPLTIEEQVELDKKEGFL